MKLFFTRDCWGPIVNLSKDLRKNLSVINLKRKDFGACIEIDTKLYSTGENKNLDKIIPRLIISHLSLERFEGALFYLFRFYSIACNSKQDENNSIKALKKMLDNDIFKEI